MEQTTNPSLNVGARVKTLLANVKTSLLIPLGQEDKTRNEVLMFDDVGGLYALVEGATVTTYAEISNDIGNRKDCWFVFKDDDPDTSGHYEIDTGTLMCTDPSAPRVGDSVGTSDIIIRRSKFQNDALQVPESNARFNRCGNDSDRKYSAYPSFLHEAGHALGISGHPEIADAVMNYVFDEPDCSPHPFDVMAIYALYQSR